MIDISNDNGIYWCHKGNIMLQGTRYNSKKEAIRAAQICEKLLKKSNVRVYRNHVLLEARNGHIMMSNTCTNEKSANNLLNKIKRII